MARLLPIPIYLLAVAVMAISVWHYSARQSIRALERRGESDLALASDRLISTIFGFRQLAATLAGDPRLKSPATPTAELDALLARAADLSGALGLVLLDRERQPRAGGFDNIRPDWVDAAFIGRAFDGAMGTYLMVSGRFDRRAMLVALPVFSEAGPVLRALVVIIDLERIEADFRGSRPAVFITDEDGVIYFSNRSELVLRTTSNIGASVPAPLRQDQDPPHQEGFPGHSSSQWLGTEIWTIQAGRYLPRNAIHVVRDLPVINMRAEALVNARPAFATAFLQAAVLSFAFLLFGATLFFIIQQRRTLALANEALEDQVSARTRQLVQTNTTLRAQVAERIEAEKALNKAQANLIQAEKLNALGKMSAGISHELNQPLMAIQSFAENAAQFLQQGKADKAAGNLTRISDLALRMARIIRNFRAFARQEKDTVARVDLIGAINAAIDLAEVQLKRHQVTVQFAPPASAVWVQGGEVRLQQVVLNLISNAIDAMVGRPERRIEITISLPLPPPADEPGRPVTLRIQDTGPGIAEPDKVFEPFYSTKSIGEAEGVGLGLSISYGLVQSFGGRIRGITAPEGGAVFTVELQPWLQEPPS